MPLHACDVSQCRRPAVRTTGSCVLCNRHICAMHLSKEHHECPSDTDESEILEQESRRVFEEELTATLARMNLSALRSRASSLRGGLDCTISSDAISHATLAQRMGGQNLHIELSFADGLSWLCRIQRQNATSPPPDVQNAVLLSEAATLRFLASTTVPVPEVYEVAQNGTGNDVGVGYILMQKLEGRPLYIHRLDATGRRKVLQQYANVYIELSKCTFPAIGCIQDLSSFEIGPLVHERTVTRSGSGDAIVQLGPFTSALDMYTAFAKQQIRFILDEELYVDDPVTAILVYRYLLDIMPTIIPEAMDGADEVYLKHMDDKGDHILVDDDLNIVGIVDWEWAQTMPKRLAFSAPFFLLDVGLYFSGRNELSSDETHFASILEAAGRNDLAVCIRNGRFYHRLASCLEGDISNMEYMRVFWGLRVLLGLTKHDDPKRDWESWRAEMEFAYRMDPDVEALKNRRASWQ